jgi:transcriptional regulator with XRE-family HTH domain
MPIKTYTCAPVRAKMLMMIHQQGARILRLKLLRLDRGDTAFAVARSIDRSVGRYSYLERGLVSPTPKERDALAKYFGVSPATLFRSAIRKAARAELRVP